MGVVVSIDGTLYPPDEAKVPVFDRGFLFGDRVSETLRTYGGVPFALEEHLGRLQRAASRIAIALPVPLGQLRGELDAAVAAAGNPESSIRVIVTRGAGEIGLDTALAQRPLRIMVVQPLAPLEHAPYAHGITVVTVATGRADDATSGFEAAHRGDLANVLALRDARQRGADDAILTSRTGRVLEATGANVFLVEAGRVLTPATDAAIAAGITRWRVIDAARRLGVAVEERAIGLDALWTADEVFLTSTLRELVPVVRIDDHEVGAGVPGAFTRRLHRAFRSATRASALPMPWE